MNPHLEKTSPKFERVGKFFPKSNKFVEATADLYLKAVRNIHIVGNNMTRTAKTTIVNITNSSPLFVL